MAITRSERIRATTSKAFKKGAGSAPIFDYVQKNATGGMVKYYGVVIDGNTDNLTEIPAETYVQLTGRPDVYSIDGTWRWYPQMKKGNALLRYNRTIGNQEGYNKATIDKVLALAPFRTTALALLEMYDIPVADRNDLFEIFGRYIKAYPSTSAAIKDVDYNMWLERHVSGRSKNMFDVGSMFGGVMDILGGIINQVTGAALTAQVQSRIESFSNYMQTDFAYLATLRQEQGPQAALDYLMQLRNTSWGELEQENTAWFANHGLELPQGIMHWLQQQDELEQELRNQIAATQQPVNSGGSAPSYGTPGAGAGFNGNILLYAIIGFGGFFLLKNLLAK